MRILTVVVFIMVLLAALFGPMVDKASKDDPEHDKLMSNYKKSFIFYFAILIVLIIASR